jgi:hypothetical protein
MDIIDSIWKSLTGMSGDTMMGAGSAVVAVVSAFFSWRASRRAERRDGANLKLAHDSDIIRWSDEVILLLARTHEMLCEKGVSYPDQDFPRKRSEAKAHLSALIDRGRLFFPNRKAASGHGAEKEAGFQGHRQKALQELVAAYDLLAACGAGPGPDMDSCAKLMTHRRAFIAEVFKAVDPERRGMTLKELSA